MKSQNLTLIDLLDSNYQKFRNDVCRRLDRQVDFREAIKLANEDELRYLDNYILEEKLGI
jgi:hypothetical protein